MLKIIKDVTIRHDGREIYCTVGQIVNVKASFDINDEVAKGTEVRYADKLRTHCQRVNPTENTKVVTLTPKNIHNAVEQGIKKASEEATEIKDDAPAADVSDAPPEKEEEKTEKKKSGGKKKK